MKPPISLVITDLDDTVWYWLKVWHAAFAAELDELVRVTGIARSHLIPEIKKIHERHHTSEYAFLLQELPSLIKLYGVGFDPTRHLDSVIHAYRRARKESFALYPTVNDTLNEFKKRGGRVVAFTESQRFYTVQRILRGRLDGIIDVVYTPEESGAILDAEIARARGREDGSYDLKHTQVVTLPQRLKKPNPQVIEDILIDEDCPRERAIYMGDNLSKDVAMAREARVLCAHAKYGEAQRDSVEYMLLKEVTHWPSGDVRNEEASTVQADFVLDRNMGQVLDHINIQPR